MAWRSGRGEEVGGGANGVIAYASYLQRSGAHRSPSEGSVDTSCFLCCGAVLVLQLAAMVHRALLLTLMLVALAARGGDAAGGIIYTLLRNNLAGTPDNFVTQRWVFDPEVGKRWSVEYQRLNGIRGEDLIERVGLGEDGFTEERRVQQAERDRGVYVSRQPINGP